jgi:hypothetical protein
MHFHVSGRARGPRSRVCSTRSSLIASSVASEAALTCARVREAGLRGMAGLAYIGIGSARGDDLCEPWRCAAGAAIVESQPMTLRQYLGRERYTIIQIGLMVCCWVGMAASVYVLKPFGPLAQSLGGAGSMILLVLGSRLPRLIRCPRCSHRLGQVAEMYSLSQPGAKRRKVDASAAWKLETLGGCPNCGLRLDEEIGAKT